MKFGHKDNVEKEIKKLEESLSPDELKNLMKRSRHSAR